MASMNDNNLADSTIRSGAAQVTDILMECARKAAEEMMVVNEFATDYHKELAQRVKALTEAAIFVQRLARHGEDQNRRIGDASFTLYDWDGFYNPETQQGDLVKLAELVEDAFTTLQGRSWRDEKHCDGCAVRLKEGKECYVDALPVQITSANKGESAVLCTACWHEVMKSSPKKASKGRKAKNSKKGK